LKSYSRILMNSFHQYGTNVSSAGLPHVLNSLYCSLCGEMFSHGKQLHCVRKVHRKSKASKKHWHLKCSHCSNCAYISKPHTECKVESSPETKKKVYGCHSLLSKKRRSSLKKDVYNNEIVSPHSKPSNASLKCFLESFDM
jgi:hypothetical protein